MATFKLQRFAQDGTVYIRMYKLENRKWVEASNPYFGVYLIDRDDKHTHPWFEVSLFKKGRYGKEVRGWDTMNDNKIITLEDFLKEIKRRLTEIKKFSLECEEADKNIFYEKVFVV